MTSLNSQLLNKKYRSTFHEMLNLAFRNFESIFYRMQLLLLELFFFFFEVTVIGLSRHLYLNMLH